MCCASSGPRRRGRGALTLGLALLLAVLLGPARAGAGESYPLGPRDQLRLKIYEWRASRDTIFEWTALNDVFTIGADGVLSLPFAGRIAAEGLETGALADAIADSLARNMGLSQRPDVAVEVVGFRPFYILGDVARPGEFAYRPGLNVLKAVSVAGGLPPEADGFSRVGREILAGQGELEELALSRAGLLARQARLSAEAANAEAITFPGELTGAGANSAAPDLMARESALFQARRDGLGTQLRALDELGGFLDREIDSLGKQLDFLDQRIASLREELDTVSTLVDKGLAVTSRRMELERSLLQGQSDRLTAETGLLRARQEASRTELSMIELRNERAREVAGDLREVEPQIREVAEKTRTARALLGESAAAALRLAGGAPSARPRYTIIRPAADGEMRELAAAEATEVRPGDTVRVELPPPGSLDAAAPPGGEEAPLPRRGAIGPDGPGL